MDGESLPTARINNIIAKFDDRAPIHYCHSKLDNARSHAQIFSVYTDQYRLTDPFNAPSDGRLNGKVFSSCDQNIDKVDSTNCGEKEGGWWYVKCAGIEPNDRYEDNYSRQMLKYVGASLRKLTK